jgi:ribose transport system substrate-binding protein
MPDNQKKVAVVFHRVEEQPWSDMVKEDMETALVGHPEIIAQFADPKGQADRQVQMLIDFLKAGVDALIVFLIDAEKARSVIREYRKAAIPVIALGNDPGDPELYRTLIIPDNLQYGRAVGSFFVEVTGGEGELVEICGPSSFSGSVERSAGFREALAGSPGLQIVERCTGNWLCEQARREFAQILAKRRAIDGVFAHNDEMARGAWEAAQAAGRDQELLITGIDAIRGERGIQMVIQGHIAATFINPSSGKSAIDALLVILRGGTCLPKRLLHTSPLRSAERIRAWQRRRRR